MSIDLFMAVRSGSLEDIKKCHANGGDIHYTDDTEGGYNTHTLLHVAAERQYQSKEEALAIMSYLIEQGLDINAIHLVPDEDWHVSCTQETPLIRAARMLKWIHPLDRQGKYQAIDALLELNANVNRGFTVDGKSLAHYVKNDPYLIYKLCEKPRGLNPFKIDACNDSLAKRFRMGDCDFSVRNAVESAIANAEAAGLPYVQYNENAIAEPSLWPWLMEHHQTVALALKEILTKALVCDAHNPDGFRELYIGRQYEVHPMYLPSTYTRLNEQGIDLTAFGTQKQQKHILRSILRHVISELTNNPNISGGIQHYDVIFGRNDVPNETIDSIKFAISNDYIASIRKMHKVANPGSSCIIASLMDSVGFYGLKATGRSIINGEPPMPTPPAYSGGPANK